MTSTLADHAERSVDASPATRHVASVNWWAFVVAVALVWAIAIWVISLRSSIGTPSLVDDWSAIARSPDQLSEVLSFGNPEQQRYRPGWILWNYVQWHTFGAPDSLVGPNVWNYVRALVLVAGLSLLTVLVLPPPSQGRLDGVVNAGLAGLPALLVITAPKFAVDLTRFGPQEPLLVGGLALGGSLLVVASAALLDAARTVPWWAVLAAFAGSVLWVIGTYQKETSLAALPLLAAVAFLGRRKTAVWKGLSGRRHAALLGLLAVTVFPLLHVAVESIRIVARGDLVYDAQVDGGRGAWRGLVALYDWAHEALPPYWRLCAYGALVAVPVVALVRRKVDVVAIGLLGAAALAFVLVAQAEVVSTRYYIPVFALLAVALTASLGWFPLPVRLFCLLGAVVLFLPPTSAREEVTLWVESEERQATLVHTLAELHSSGCRIAAAGLLAEASLALPVLVAVEQRVKSSSCDGDVAYVVAGTQPEGAALLKACQSDARKLVLEIGELATVHRCTRLRSTPIRDPALGVVSPEELIALYRFRPGLES